MTAIPDCRRCPAPPVPRTWRSSWTATAAGRRPGQARVFREHPRRRRRARVAAACGERGIEYLTLFGSAPRTGAVPDEVSTLMKLFVSALRRESTSSSNSASGYACRRRFGLDAELAARSRVGTEDRAQRQAALTICANYGGRWTSPRPPVRGDAPAAQGSAAGEDDIAGTSRCRSRPTHLLIAPAANAASATSCCGSSPIRAALHRRPVAGLRCAELDARWRGTHAQRRFGMTGEQVDAAPVANVADAC